METTNPIIRIGPLTSWKFVYNIVQLHGPAVRGRGALRLSCWTDLSEATLKTAANVCNNIGTRNVLSPPLVRRL